jgi:hypothetical protein
MTGPQTEDARMALNAKWGCIGFGLLFGAALSIAGGLVLYGIVLLIFRHAFGVELPNPFH